jgi:hypothetical protein
VVAPEIRGSDLESGQLLIANSIKVRMGPSTVSRVLSSIKYFSFDFHFTDFISKPVTFVPGAIFHHFHASALNFGHCGERRPS